MPYRRWQATAPELKEAIEQHLIESENQVERLERIFSLFDETPRGKKCPAMDGLIEEGKEVMEEAVQPLKETLKEEKNADKLLSSLAESKLNREAA